MLIIIGVFYSLAIAWFFQSLPSFKLTSDFFPRWHASRMLLETGRSVYDWQNADEISAVTGWHKLHQLGYYYPAYLLLVTAPLSMLPYNVAHIIWVICGLWFLWFGTFIFYRLTAPKMRMNQLTLLLVLVTTAIPIFQHTQFAQFNSIGVLSIALVCWALSRKKYLIAGMLAGGLLVKPHATIIVLIFFLLWTVLKRERWLFWVGLAIISIILWVAAELFERNWVFTFLGTLNSYEPIRSIIDILFVNPFQIFSLILFVLTLWFIFQARQVAATDTTFYGLLVWAISINALIVPMFGMLHMVIMGPVLVILLGQYQINFPTAASWIWRLTVAMFILGLAVFILPLLLTDSMGLQITFSEMVYRFTMPFLFCVAALPLIFVKEVQTKWQTQEHAQSANI